jgi:hypothetical protein
MFDNDSTKYVPYKIFPLLQATDLSEASEESVEKQLRNVNTSSRSFIYVNIFYKRLCTKCCGFGSGIRCLFDPWIPGWVKRQEPDPG